MPFTHGDLFQEDVIINFISDEDLDSATLLYGLGTSQPDQPQLQLQETSAEMLERQVEGDTQETAAEVGKLSRADHSTMAGTDSSVVTEDRNNREQSVEEVISEGH